MNEEQRKRLQKEIIKENFYMTYDTNYNAVYRSLIPGMENEMLSSDGECLAIIKSRPEIMDQIIGEYLDEKQGIYVYEGKKYRKDELVKAIFYSNNASRNLKKIDSSGES